MVGPVVYLMKKPGKEEFLKVPRYEYKCKKCNKSFDVVHGIDETEEACEQCGGPVRRVFHPVGLVFKGPGFYATDSRNPVNNQPATVTEKKEEAGTTAAGDDSGEKGKEKKPGDSTKAASDVSSKE